MKVVFTTPSLGGPTDPYVKALEESIPLIVKAGWEHGYVHEMGCPYISAARAMLTRKALDAGADVVVYLDYDLSWEPSALLKLLEVPGDVVAGTYRFKKEEEEYMGTVVSGPGDTPLVRDDGCIESDQIPAGFMKITKKGIDRFMTVYPELTYGPKYNLSVDLFNHGAHKGIWYGEDYAFSRNWRDMGEKIWIVPDLAITHHSKDKAYPGNFHKFLMKQPGGIDEEKK